MGLIDAIEKFDYHEDYNSRLMLHGEFVVPSLMVSARGLGSAFGS